MYLRDEWNRSGLPLNRTIDLESCVAPILLEERIFRERLFEKLTPSIWSGASRDIIVVFCERMALVERLLNAWKFSLSYGWVGRGTSKHAYVLRRERVCTSNIILSYLILSPLLTKRSSCVDILNFHARVFIPRSFRNLIFEFWAGEKFLSLKLIRKLIHWETMHFRFRSQEWKG